MMSSRVGSDDATRVNGDRQNPKKSFHRVPPWSGWLRLHLLIVYHSTIYLSTVWEGNRSPGSGAESKVRLEEALAEEGAVLLYSSISSLRSLTFELRRIRQNVF